MLCKEKMLMPFTVLRASAAPKAIDYVTDGKTVGMFVWKRDYILGQEAIFVSVKPYQHGRTLSKQQAITLTTEMPPFLQSST